MDCQRLSGVSFRSLKSLQFGELYKGKFPDRNYIGPVVHFPRIGMRFAFVKGAVDVLKPDAI